MSRAVATRAELEAEITAAHHELLDAAAKGDVDGQILAHARCDALLDRWALIPKQRE